MGEIGKTNFKIHTDKFPGIYRGTVMDNNDPLQYGRVKVKIYPMLADVETTNLPWAVPMYPIFEGAGTGAGYFAVPDIGTNVFIMFEMGDIYQPVYIGEAPDAVKGLPTDRTTNYPNRKVLKTSSGIVVYIDDTAIDLKVVHPSGSYVLIDNNGDIKITCHRNAEITTTANTVVNAVDVDINATNVDITASGTASLTANGTVTITGSSVDINP